MGQEIRKSNPGLDEDSGQIAWLINRDNIRYSFTVCFVIWAACVKETADCGHVYDCEVGNISDDNMHI
jgi:hypothetical protein